MYNAQNTKKRIMEQCKNQSAEQMLKDLSLGVNAIRQINDTKGMSSFSLAKIADYLDCSVDYLLGRTDNPDAHKHAPLVSTGNISGSNAIGIANSAPVTIENGKSETQSTQEVTLLATFRELDEIAKAKVLVYMDEIKKGE